MSSRHSVSLLATFLIACSTAPTTPLPESPVRIAATASTAPFVRSATDREITGTTPFEITFAVSNSDLLAKVAGGAADVGVTLYLPENSILWAAPLGDEALAVIVNPSNPTNDLTLAQVQDIFAGRASEWQAAVREDGDDSRLAFEAMALRGLKPALTAVVMPSPEAMLKFVSETPNGIGYLPLQWVSDSVRPVMIDGRPPTADNYELKVLIVAVAKEEPTGKAREWVGGVQEAEGGDQ